MAKAKIVRPLQGRLLVWLPFRTGSGNYDLLKEICGERTLPTYESGHFEVARDHVDALVTQLASALGQSVTVVLHGSSQTKCVEACWNASPDTYLACVCSCASVYHGQKVGPPKELGEGLAVSTEYTTHTFTVDP